MSTSLAFDWFRAPAGYAPDFGRSVYIIGTASLGPIREPVPIVTEADIRAVFGSDGSLPEAVKRALSARRDALVYGVRVSGEYASAAVKAPTGDGFGPVLNLRAAFGGAAFNGTRVALTDTGITITPPSGVGYPRYYTYRDYPTIGALVMAINVDTDRGAGVVYASSPHGLLDADSLWTGLNYVLLRGGQDGVDLDRNRLFLALEQTYEVLLGSPADYVVPVGAYLDDPDLRVRYGYVSDYPFRTPEDSLRLLDTEDGNRPVSFHEQLIRFCRRQHSSGRMTHGVIGLRPLDHPFWQEASEFAYTTMLLQRTALRDRYGFVDASGDVVDQGHYCSIVCGDLLYHAGSSDEHYANGAVSYAVMLATLGSDLSTTAKPVPGAASQRVEFSDREAYKLASLGVVTFRTSVKHGLVVNNGVTAALAETDLHSIVNFRLVALTLAHVNAVVAPYIGESLVPMIQSRELERRLRLTLDALQHEAGVLADYRLKVQYDLGRRMIRLLLDLKTRQAVEFVSTSAEMRYVA